MRRRHFLALGGAAGALAARRDGARPGVPLVGILGLVASDEDPHTIIARRAELGFADGRNVEFAIRSFDARGAVPAVAAELPRLRPAVMAVVDTRTVPAARDAMPATPVVTVSGDLAAAGLAQSVARRGASLRAWR